MVKLKKIIKKLITAVLVLILSTNLLTLIFSVTGLREPLRWLPFALLTVNSGSMEPIISPGDALLVAEMPYAGLEVGDIVTFHHGGELVSHEIIRKTNNRFITKGSANNYSDEPIGPEEYCAKVILILPDVGWILSFLSKPYELVLISLLLALLLYGHTIINNLYEKVNIKRVKTEDVRPVKRRTGVRRVLALFAGISCAAVVPFVTAAKYTAKINAYESLLASSINFTSNYLMPEGYDYYIQGWNGTDYHINLCIRNYSNDLLWNKDGQDLFYGLCIIPVEADSGGTYAPYGASNKYTVYVTSQDTTAVSGAPYTYPESWPASNRYGPYRMSGDSTQKQQQQFSINVTAYGLAMHDKVKFKIAAATSEQDQFYIELLGSFTLEVKGASGFLNTPVITETKDSALVTCYVSTNLIDDGDAVKDVRFTWDPVRLYINEFEPVTADIIASRPGNYDKTGGTLIVPLQAFSNITLQFFKYDTSYNLKPDDITALLIE